jgi:hypothetical protein
MNHAELLKQFVEEVHGSGILPSYVYIIADECSVGESYQFRQGIQCLLGNLAGAVADGDLEVK